MFRRVREELDSIKADKQAIEDQKNEPLYPYRENVPFDAPVGEEYVTPPEFTSRTFRWLSGQDKK